MTVAAKRNQTGRRRGTLVTSYDVRDGRRQGVHVAVNDPREPGIRLDIHLGSDGRTVYVEAYHWYGKRQPIKIVSTTTGEAIDTQQPADRPHPEFAIVEDGPLGPAR